MLRNIKINQRHFFFYPLVFLILLTIISFIGIRVTLPKINTYKDEIQSVISEHMGYSLNIKKIEAEWENLTPNLYLEDIKLLDQNTNIEIIEFHSAKVGINLLESIFTRKIIPSYILIAGLNIEIYRNKDGLISIKDENTFNTDTHGQTGLTKWLFAQKHLILKNVSLTWDDENIEVTNTKFENISIDLKTIEKNEKIEINLNLPHLPHYQPLKIKAEITGNISTSDWDGNISIEGTYIEPEKLFKKLPSKGGIANLKILSSWKSAKLVNFNGTIDYSDFLLTTGKTTIESSSLIKNINFNIDGERKSHKDWSLNFDIKNLQTQNGIWPSYNYQIEFVKDLMNDEYQYNAYLPFLKLEDIRPLIIRYNLLPNNILKKLNLYSLSGDVTDIEVEIKSEKESLLGIKKIAAIFSNLNFMSYDKSNVIKGLEGKLINDDLSINIKIDSKSPEFRFDKLYAEKIIVPNLSAELKLNHKDYNKLLIDNLKIFSNEISLTTNGRILLGGDSAFVDVELNLDESNIEYFSKLIPDKTNPELSSWLKNSMLGGRIISGDISYKGYGEDFLFENSKSDFKMALNLSDVNLEYHPNWPPIDKLVAEVTIENNELIADIISGYIFNAQINNISTIIKDLNENNPHVVINTEIYSHTNDIRNFIDQSPLKNNSTITELTENIIGNIDISLNLDIPLNSEDIEFSGLVLFDNTSIESGIPELGLESVSGEVYFNINEIWANNINAIYLGKPVTLNIPKTNYSELDFLPFEMSGFFNKQFIIEQITSFFPKLLSNIENIRTYFSGESQWTFKIQKLKENNTLLSSKKIELSSDLYGTEINLPNPLGKDKNEICPITLETKISDITINEININYKDKIFTDIVIADNNESLIKKVNIGLGEKHPVNEYDNTISIHGEINNLSFSDWASLTNTSKTEENNLEQKKIILGEISVKNLEIVNKIFNDIDINFTNSKTNGDWNIIFDGEEIKGTASYTKRSKNKNDYLYVNFKNLSLNENKNIENVTSYDVNKIPELGINIENFIYKNNELGNLNLSASKKVENVISIDKLNFRKSGFNINANGSWSNIDGEDKSNFHIKLESDSIEKMFNAFNYETANIKNGKTFIEIDADWVGSPMDFQMINLNGQLNMDIEKGQFLDIEPKAGRLFGLLSIQSLPRRLSLDFVDLFDEGFAFDTIKGNFNLENGQAYTNNLQMIGPSGDIMISGRTGLVTEDYDQIATVIPKVSDSLPVASALFGPVGVGVGAVLFFAGELFESIPNNIDKILTQQYSIKGSWMEPEINKISFDKKTN